MYCAKTEINNIDNLHILHIEIEIENRKGHVCTHTDIHYNINTKQAHINQTSIY